MTVNVTLGGVTLQGFELPEAIPFGGDQMMVVHKLIGGQRVIDTLGRDDAALEWTARFVGSDALSRAQQVDALRIAGAPVTLSWSSLSYSVVIRSFRPKYRADYWLDYDLTCEVVSDTASPDATADSPSLDDQMSDDLSTLSDQATSIDDSVFSGQIGSLTSAIDAVSNFATAPGSVLTSVLGSIGDAQGTLSDLVNSAQDVLAGDLGSLAGPIAGNLISQAVSALQLPDLYAAGSVLSRMASNVGAAGISGASLTTVGGDLSFVAASVYGDASAWTTIARANDLTDPVLEGINTLIIPPASDGQDGVLVQ